MTGYPENTRRPSDVALLDKTARDLIGDHGITAEELTEEFQADRVPRNEGWSGRVELLVLTHVRDMAPESLARLVFAVPDADLFGVHGGAWLGWHDAGPFLVHKIAATAVVCRIRNILGVSEGTAHYSPEYAGTA